MNTPPSPANYSDTLDTSERESIILDYAEASLENSPLGVLLSSMAELMFRYVELSSGLVLRRLSSSSMYSEPVEDLIDPY